VDPQFAGPVIGLRVTGPMRLSDGSGFALGPRSPLRGAGLDLPALFGVQPGPSTFSGRATSLSAPDVGAQ
jgi:hypothetical protein